MAWLVVSLLVEGNHIANVLNTDTIVRIGPRADGCYIRLSDGSTIECSDDFKQLVSELQKMKG